MSLTKNRTIVPTVLATIVIVALTGYFLFPLFWQLMAITKDSTQLATTNGLLPSIPPHLWENVQRLFAADGGSFPRWLVNSVLYSGVGGVLCTFVSGAAGYALARLHFRGRKVVTAAVLIGTMIPATVLAFPLYLVLVRLGLVDTYWAFLLPSLVSPLAVFLARMSASQSIPVEILEAARIDGAGEIGIAFRIGFRLMSPGLVTILLIEVVAIWNNFFLPLMVLSSSNLYPSTLGLYIWNTRVSQAPEYQVLILLGALISCLPLVVLFLTLQRYWRSDIAAGGVKG